MTMKMQKLTNSTFVWLPLLTLLSYCGTTKNQVPANTEPAIAAVDSRPWAKAQVAGIEEIYARPITDAFKLRILDCREYSSGLMGFRSETPEFDLFNTELNEQRKFYLAEEGGWPFVVGYHNLDRIKPDSTWLVTLRGESSGFHSSSVTKPILSLLEKLPDAAMITIDEYRYNKRQVKGERVLSPICHRARYPERFINTESPGFENGGAMKLLKRVLPSPNPIIIMSYSNATTPRGEFVSRKVFGDEKIDYKHFGDPKQFLTDYILKTTYDENVYPAIKGFIDIEGNYEYNKALWDLLAFIKLEIERDAARFYYSAIRIEKFDAYPVQTTMIRALDLEGVENETGVIRFSNPAGNVIIDVITNHFQPYYYGVGGDIRKNTRMKPFGPGVKRTVSNHYIMGPFISQRLRETTPFLKKEMGLTKQ